MVRFGSLLLMLFLNSCLDVKYKRISVLLCVLFGIEAICLNIRSGSSWYIYAFGFLTGIFVVVMSKLTKGAIGMGDGYVICVVGLFMGIHMTVQVLMGAFLLAAMVSLVLLVVRKMKKGMTMPFIPFLLLSACLQIKGF